MDNGLYPQEREALIAAAKAASSISSAWFEKARASENPDKVLHTIHKKGDFRTLGYQDVFTQADIDTEDEILGILKSCRDILIVSEEKNPLCPEVPDVTQRWLVDPIDGTSQFKQGKEAFSVTLALQTKRDGEWVTDIGVVAVPMKNSIYVADDRGAAKIIGDNTEAINVTSPCPIQAFVGSRSKALRGKLIENVVYSHSNPILMKTHHPFREALKTSGANVSTTYSSALVHVEMVERDGVDAIVLAGSALDFAWDTDAAFHIGHKAGLSSKKFELDGEPVVIFAKDPSTIPALEVTLRDTYYVQKLNAAQNPVHNR
ncbi:MAG: inositol monophosphatase family protein [Rickettsiales bacterium]